MGNVRTLDMDRVFYCFSPLILWLYKKNPRVGRAATLGLIALCLLITAFIVHFHKWQNGVQDFSLEFFAIYTQAFTRAGPYLIGVWLFMRYNEEILEGALSSPVAGTGSSLLAWVGGLLAIFSIIFKDRQTSSTDPITRWLIYLFSRLMFASGLAALMWLGIQPLGEEKPGFLKRVLSSRVLYVIAQLSYTMYLLSFNAMTWFVDATGCSLVGTSFWTYLGYLLGVAAFDLAISFPVHMLIERPLMRINPWK